MPFTDRGTQIMETRKYCGTLTPLMKKYNKFSEMTESEMMFLCGLIKETQSKKIVEIGVASGTSSLLMLDTIKNTENAHLYSIDYSTEYYRDVSKKSGFVVDDFPDLKQKWTLYTGAMSCRFLENIGKEIDLCFIDTMHCSPGEFLDYLQVLPFMKKDGIIVLHDIAFHTYENELWNTCCILFSAIHGQKILPEYTEHKYVPNIGAVKLSPDAMEEAFDIFNALTLAWAYPLKDKDFYELKKHYEKYYPRVLTNIFEKAYILNSRLIDKDKQVQSLYAYSKKLYLTLKYLKLHYFRWNAV